MPSGPGWLFADSLGQLAAALRAGAPAGTAVVQAPPGTGKTTLVPPLLANLAGSARRGRPAVRASWSPSPAASPPARPPGAWPPWTAAGWVTAWATRSAGNARPAPGPLIEFVTPGILLRRLLADPGLEGTDAVILDEVHERGLETDLLLGMLGEVRQLRGDLTLVAMSATLDAPRFAALIGDPRR